MLKDCYAWGLFHCILYLFLQVSSKKVPYPDWGFALGLLLTLSSVLFIQLGVMYAYIQRKQSKVTTVNVAMKDVSRTNEAYEWCLHTFVSKALHLYNHLHQTNTNVANYFHTQFHIWNKSKVPQFIVTATIFVSKFGLKPPIMALCPLFCKLPTP